MSGIGKLELRIDSQFGIQSEFTVGGNAVMFSEVQLITEMKQSFVIVKIPAIAFDVLEVKHSTPLKRPTTKEL